jgi:hypothetical protein
LGRYESQRAIAARTIYERRQGRKRGLRWAGWSFLRLTALALAAAAILAAAWFNPRQTETAAPAPPPPAPTQVRDLTAYKVAAAPQSPRPQPRRGIHRTVAPIHGAVGIDPFEGAEVLSIAELDGVSQAR